MLCMYVCMYKKHFVRLGIGSVMLFTSEVISEYRRSFIDGNFNTFCVKLNVIDSVCDKNKFSKRWR